MMIAYADKLLILGIEPENITRMKAGRPIRITKNTHPGYPLDTDIVICVGEPDDLVKQLRDAGAMRPDAPVFDHRTKAKES